VRSNGMISGGTLNKCSQVVPPEINEGCNFERLSSGWRWQTVEDGATSSTSPGVLRKVFIYLILFYYFATHNKLQAE